MTLNSFWSMSADSFSGNVFLLVNTNKDKKSIAALHWYSHALSGSGSPSPPPPPCLSDSHLIFT